MPLTRDKKLKMLAGGLGVLLTLVVYFQFFYGGSSTPTPPPGRGQAATQVTPTPFVRVIPRDTRIEQVAITEPLPLELLNARHSAGSGTGRNIFIYPTPTPTPSPKPVPTPTPPPPPPITIAGLNPSGVIARTKAFDLVIMGAKIPRDAVAIVNGQNLPTAFISDAQLKVAVPATSIKAPGDLRVEVRSLSNPSLYSNHLNLVVGQPPVPPYLFVALVINSKGVKIAVLKSQAEGKFINVRQGEALDRKWKVLTIGNQSIEILDVEYNIPHTVAFTGEAG